MASEQEEATAEMLEIEEEEESYQPPSQEPLESASSYVDKPGSIEDYQYENERYFGQYERFEIHCAMLRDKHRCSTYRQAIDSFSEEHFKGKAVLDVGCGSGVLSCFAARAGARVVYAVEASAMAAKARLIVARNGFDGVIHVLNTTVEQLELPEQVDVIVSEWMGSFLLFESMLESVLFARDRWLKPDGVMYPRYANIYMAPFSYPEFWQANLGFLNDIEGLDLGALAPAAREQFTEGAMKSMVLPAELLISDGQIVRRIDTRTIKFEELPTVFSTAFKYQVESRAESNDLPVMPFMPSLVPWKTGDPIFFHGFVLWFETVFNEVDASPDRVRPPLASASSSSSSTPSSSQQIVLTTRPGNRTHWEQDVCLFPDIVPCKIGDSITGVVRMKRNDSWKRHYDLEFSFRVGDQQIYKYYVL